jgi:hypothetical protein
MIMLTPMAISSLKVSDRNFSQQHVKEILNRQELVMVDQNRR